jgi:protein-S-isoprenylcysteine O-methyltransferase Ste14
MIPPPPPGLDLIPWYGFAAYWAISAFRVNRTKAAETSIQRLATLAVMTISFLLLFDQKLPAGPLDRRFPGPESTLAWAGVALTAAGLGLAVWARFCLGRYWSARVTLKQDHRLIRGGPYAWVRHPIYTGMLGGALGRTLVLGEWRGVLAVVLMLVTHSLKARREEAMLYRQFGEEYASYRRSTGFLFPGL